MSELPDSLTDYSLSTCIPQDATDLQKMVAGKRGFRMRLAALPVAEKLRMLDALRERELAIRGRPDDSLSSPDRVREDSAPYS
jgi:hypothetical protein